MITAELLSAAAEGMYQHDKKHRCANCSHSCL